MRGTLRSNIDPDGCQDDEAIWEALEKVRFKDHPSIVAKGLDMQIERGGDNLSNGERQLVWLARVMLCRAKIVVLDEATSNVDPRLEHYEM